MSEMTDFAARKCGRYRRGREGEEPLVEAKIRAKMPHEYLWMDAVSVPNSVYDIGVESRVLSGERISMIADGDEAILGNDRTLVEGVKTLPCVFF